jgi:hypothetical protein
MQMLGKRLVVDGLLIKTRCPGKKETNKPRDYKSGHYK